MKNTKLEVSRIQNLIKIALHVNTVLWDRSYRGVVGWSLVGWSRS